MKQIDFSRNIVRVNGNTLRLVNETTAALLWEGETPGGGKFWEVWKVRIRKESKTLPGGKIFRAGEFIMPSNEDFGTHAWAYQHRNIKRMQARINELNEALTRRIAA